MTALRKLIEAVEVGGRAGVVEYLDAMPASMWTKVMEAFGGSLDAAKALHEAILPNRYWTINHWDHAYNVTVPVSGESSHDGFSEDNPARAWLIAILKAYEAQQGDNA